MLRPSEIREGEIYMHDDRQVYARLLRVIGDTESGGAATIEIAGQATTMGLALFMRKFNVVQVQELGEDAYKDQG